MDYCTTHIRYTPSNQSLGLSGAWLHVHYFRSIVTLINKDSKDFKQQGARAAQLLIHVLKLIRMSEKIVQWVLFNSIKIVKFN